MKLVSRAKLAELCEVSRPAISQAISRGTIDLIGDGRTAKVDITSKKTVEYINACEDKKAAGKDNKKSTPISKISEGKEPEAAEKEKQNSDNQTINLDSDGIDLNLLSAASANKLKTLEDIKTKRQARLAARKKLVQRESVQRILAKIYTIDVNEQLTVGDKLAPDIAAICKVDDPAVILAINEAIEKEMYKILGHRKRLMDEFLKEIEAEALKI